MKKSVAAGWLTLFLFLGVPLPVCADPQKEAAVRRERAALAGVWQAVSCVMDGTSALSKDVRGMRLVVDTSGRTSEQLDGRTYISGIMTIDPTSRPFKATDMVYTEGAVLGKTSWGIYQLDGDRLVICRDTATILLDDRDKKRPGSFTSLPGSGRILMVYQRVRK